MEAAREQSFSAASFHIDSYNHADVGD